MDFKEKRGREVVGNIDWLPLALALTSDPTCSLGLCPDWKSNPQPFCLLDDASTS